MPGYQDTDYINLGQIFLRDEAVGMLERRKWHLAAPVGPVLLMVQASPSISISPRK